MKPTKAALATFQIPIIHPLCKRHSFLLIFSYSSFNFFSSIYVSSFLLINQSKLYPPIWVNFPYHNSQVQFKHEQIYYRCTFFIWARPNIKEKYQSKVHQVLYKHIDSAFWDMIRIRGVDRAHCRLGSTEVVQLENMTWRRKTGPITLQSCPYVRRKN